jgi:hypothetical protein
MPKLSELKLPPKVALKMFSSRSLSKLPPRSSAGWPVNIADAESMLIEICGLVPQITIDGPLNGVLPQFVLDSPHLHTERAV